MQGASCSLCSCSVPFLRFELCHPMSPGGTPLRRDGGAGGDMQTLSQALLVPGAWEELEPSGMGWGHIPPSPWRWAEQGEPR